MNKQLKADIRKYLDKKVQKVVERWKWEQLHFVDTVEDFREAVQVLQERAYFWNENGNGFDFKTDSDFEHWCDDLEILGLQFVTLALLERKKGA